MSTKVPDRGTLQNRFPGYRQVPKSGHEQDAPKRKTAPNSGARKRETDTKQKGKQRAGRSYLHPKILKGTNPKYARPENLRTQQFLEGETHL